MDESIVKIIQDLFDAAMSKGSICDTDKEAIMAELKLNRDSLSTCSLQTILDLLKKTLENISTDQEKVFNILAELAKSDKVRELCVEAGWINLALENITNNKENVVLQALRAIGNICYENDLGRQAVLDGSGTVTLAQRLKKSAENYIHTEDHQIDIVLCGCLLNLVTDSVPLTEAFVTEDAIKHLSGLIKQSNESDKALCKMAVSALSQLIECKQGKADFKKAGGPSLFLKVLKKSYKDEELAYTVLEALNPLVIEDDTLKRDLVESECVEPLVHVISSCIGRDDDEDAIFRLETASDMIVSTITEDECMTKLFQDGDGLVLDECINWLTSGIQRLEISGSLALGNFARSDTNCLKLVEKGIHKELLNLLKVANQKPESHKYIQAVFGALKNLAIPVTNKQILLNDGCLEACLEQLTSQSHLVLRNVLGAIRMLIANSQVSAANISDNDQHLDSLINLSKSSGFEDVRIEASRVLALVVKTGKSRDINQRIFLREGLAPIAEIVTSSWNIVQNEAIIALTVLVTTITPEFYEDLQRTGVTLVLLKLINEKGKLSAQSCYNAMAYLEAISLIDYFARDLHDGDALPILESLVTHSDQNIKERALKMVEKLKITGSK